MAQPTDHLAPVRDEAFGPREAGALLRRAGLGAPLEDAHRLAELGVAKAVDTLVNYANTPDPSPPRDDQFDRSVIRPPDEATRRAFQQARARRDEEAIARLRTAREEMERRDREQMGEIRRWWVERIIATPRPHEEKLTLFWHGHFATSYRKVQNSYHLYLQNQTFRKHGAGSFADLLRAMIRDPAMLAWLDNHTSNLRAPNENLAREILELFTLGPGNYTETDIKEGARALTGYTFEGNDFLFRREWHDPNPKRLFRTNSRYDGDAFVDLILQQQACAPFLAHALYRFFVDSETPAQPGDAPADTKRVVASLAAMLRSTNYQIRPALTRLFMSRHFYEKAATTTHIKSPVEIVVGTLRTLRTPPRDARLLLDAMARSGQDLFFPPTVAGWAGGRAWINTSTLLTRQNAVVFLLTGLNPRNADRPGAAFLARGRDYDPLAGVPSLAHARTARELAGAACAAMLPIESRAAEDALAQWCADRLALESPDDPLPQRVDRSVLIALLASVGARPEYQLC